MECFGDSSDDEEGHEMAIKRDESCGVCSFHQNTEASLLTHLRNSLRSASSPTSPLDEQTKRQCSSDVLKAIDEFYMSRHWMMHVGPEKGDILLQSLHDAMNNKMKCSSLESNIPFVVVELGTYCGYASVLMGRAICKAKSVPTMNYHMFTTEIHREYAKIASRSHIRPPN